MIMWTEGVDVGEVPPPSSSSVLFSLLLTCGIITQTSHLAYLEITVNYSGKPSIGEH